MTEREQPPIEDIPQVDDDSTTLRTGGVVKLLE
jgi:hypothetical protein